MSGPLSLYPGASECIHCGHCCRVSHCGFGQWDETKKCCVHLVKKDDGLFYCAIYDAIINGPDRSWEFSPAFGAGCCSVFNSDRKAIERKPYVSFPED